MDVKAFAALQKQVKDTLGTMKEMKFVAYERFDQGDRLTYLGSYSKQQLVRVIYGFNKEGKLTEFIFAPVEVQKQEQKIIKNKTHNLKVMYVFVFYFFEQNICPF